MLQLLIKSDPDTLIAPLAKLCFDNAKIGNFSILTYRVGETHMLDSIGFEHKILRGSCAVLSLQATEMKRQKLTSDIKMQGFFEANERLTKLLEASSLQANELESRLKKSEDSCALLTVTVSALRAEKHELVNKFLAFSNCASNEEVAQLVSTYIERLSAMVIKDSFGCFCTIFSNNLFPYLLLIFQICQ